MEQSFFKQICNETSSLKTNHCKSLIFSLEISTRFLKLISIKYNKQNINNPAHFSKYTLNSH